MNDGNIVIQRSKFGKGLFARKNIAAGTILCKATSKEKELTLAQTIILKEKESHTIQIDFDKYLLCEPPFLYSNHSCNPNCAVNANLELITVKEIKAGEEIFWDYSTSMLERQWTMQCHCEEKNCRKIITDFDLLPKHLQESYLQLNMVLPFIVRYLNYQRAKSA